MICFKTNFQLFFALAIYLLTKQSLCSIIAESKIDSCKVYSDGLTNCSNKIIVAMTIQNQQTEGSEYFTFALRKFNKSSTESLVMGGAVSISISKSKLKARYPIVYRSAFNYCPYELIVESDLFTCDDKGEDTTCSKYQAAAAYTKSKGFCCDCGI